MKTIAYLLFSLFALVMFIITFFPENQFGHTDQEKNALIFGIISAVLGVIFLLVSKNKTTSSL